MKFLPHLMLYAAAGFTTISGAAHAQGQADSWPTKPITIISPFGAGGSVELEFRLYLQAIHETTSRRFIIDSKVGGGGTVGIGYVAKSAPDGYTLLGCSSSITIAPSIYPNLPYDNDRDLAPISLLSKKTYVLVVNAASPFKSAADYVAFAKARPGEINFGTAGLGGATHLPGELLHHLTSTKATFVHYKTPPQRIQDLVAGRIHAAVGTFPLVLPQLKAGKLRAIGVTSAERDPVAPDVPTIQEQGVPGYDLSEWTGLIAPARTPAPIVRELNTLFTSAAKHPDIAKKLEAQGNVMVASTPDYFKQRITMETERWRKVIAASGIKVEQ